MQPWILLVEDNALVAFAMSTHLEALTDQKVVISLDSAKTFALLEEGEPILAFLDVNLGGGTSYKIAELLVERNVPVYFVTSYSSESLGRMGLPPTLANIEVVPKAAFRREARKIISRIASEAS